MVSLFEFMQEWLKLETSKTFIKMTKSPFYAERFGILDIPNQFYMIRAYIDVYEFIFRLHKNKMIDN